MSVATSPEAKRIIKGAAKIAQVTGTTPNTLHLLLSLLVVSKEASKLLYDEGIELENVLSYFNKLTEKIDKRFETEQEMKRIATKRGDKIADSLHLLIALCNTKDSIVHKIFHDSGINMASLIRKIYGLLATKELRRYQKDHSKKEDESLNELLKRLSLFQKKTNKRSLQSTLYRKLDIKHPQKEKRDKKESRDTTSEPPRKLHTSKEVAVKEISVLDQMTTDLTKLAEEGRIGRILGRDEEISQLIEILSKRFSNNPILIGPPGVGKTAIVEGLAKACAVDNIFDSKNKKRILKLDVGSILAGTQYRGSLSEKLKALIKEVEKNKDSVVLFIDEIHTIIGSGAVGESAYDVANELKQALARGSFPCIGATTDKEYKKYFTKDSAFARRFTPIVVKEPSKEAALTILLGIKEEFEEHHNVKIDKDAIELILDLSISFIPDRFLPDKAVSILDQACARAKRLGQKSLKSDTIYSVVSDLSGLPVSLLTLDIKDQIKRLTTHLKDHIFGQDEAIDGIVKIIKKGFAARSRNKPLASVLLAGPTGTGKTETAKRIAEALFGDSSRLLRVDMAEFSESHSVSRMVGSPPGYVGHGDTESIFAPLKKQPFSVVLIDELEKAHPKVITSLLSILDNGQLMLSDGDIIHFNTSIIIMTTNAGSELLEMGNEIAIGFDTTQEEKESKPKKAFELLSTYFPKEFLTRINGIFIYHHLNKKAAQKAFNLMIKEATEDLKHSWNVDFELEDDLYEKIINTYLSNKQEGLRQMRHWLENSVVSLLVEALIDGDLKPDNKVIIYTNKEGRLDFKEVQDA